MSGKPLASSESLTGCLRWSGKTRSGKGLPIARSGCIYVSSLTRIVSQAKRSLGGPHLTVLWTMTQGSGGRREAWPPVSPTPQDSSLTADKGEQAPAQEQRSAGARHTDTAQERGLWVFLGYYWCLEPC